MAGIGLIFFAANNFTISFWSKGFRSTLGERERERERERSEENGREEVGFDILF